MATLDYRTTGNGPSRRLGQSMGTSDLEDIASGWCDLLPTVRFRVRTVPKQSGSKPSMMTRRGLAELVRQDAVLSSGQSRLS